MPLRQSVNNHPLVRYPSASRPQRLHTPSDHTWFLRCAPAMTSGRLSDQTVKSAPGIYDTHTLWTGQSADDCPLSWRSPWALRAMISISADVTRVRSLDRPPTPTHHWSIRIQPAFRSSWKPLQPQTQMHLVSLVMADFGQSDFGQPSLASPNWWPTLANPTLASVSVLVVWPTLAKTDFGQNRLWPKSVWPKSVWPKSDWPKSDWPKSVG